MRYDLRMGAKTKWTPQPSCLHLMTSTDIQPYQHAVHEQLEGTQHSVVLHTEQAQAVLQ
jgi:hypothetical protein